MKSFICFFSMRPWSSRCSAAFSLLRNEQLAGCWLFGLSIAPVAARVIERLDDLLLV